MSPFDNWLWVATVIINQVTKTIKIKLSENKDSEKL